MKHSNIKKNVINSKSLSFRESFNKKYQINNFDDLILKNYKFKKNMEILDIGCGNGKQIIQAIKILKKSGRIVGIDLSKKSILAPVDWILPPFITFIIIRSTPPNLITFSPMGVKITAEINKPENKMTL